MKKFFTLLILFITALSVQTKAQNCDPAFSFSFLSNNNLKFTPTVVGDTPFVRHSWNFGDGSPLAAVLSPTHVYAAAGTYIIKHFVNRVNPNGVLVCSDSMLMTVVIQTVNSCNLSAAFTWQQDGTSPRNIHFTNTTLAASATDSIRWTFGDGTSSLDVNPTHLYANAGAYTVCLRVKRAVPLGTTPCISEICFNVVIAEQCQLAANFTWSSVASNPLSILFQNTSVVLAPSDSVRWTFGDGTTSLLANPMHTYATAGTYTVCLRVKKNNTPAGSAACVSEICKTAVVSEGCNLQAGFTFSHASNNPLLVSFQNTSTPLSPADSIRWTFGDGTISTAVSPTHTYAHAGTYQVCLRVKKITSNANGNCVREICSTVVIAEVPNCNLVANFVWSNTAASPMTFAFHNTSTPTAATDSTRWTFGDGTSSLAANPTHTYTNPGTYTVCLRVKKLAGITGAEPCVREICKTIVVLPTNTCELQASFVWTNTTNPLTFQFQNLSAPLSATDSVRWTFGDGTSSLAVNPSHSFANAGVYNVCLRVKKNGNAPGTTPCVREICKLVTVLPQISCDSIHVGFTFQRDPVTPNKLYFYANANNLIQDQTWTITKLALFTQPTVTLHQNNPVYVFNDSGNYRVCLRAVTVGGCVKEYCVIIHIEHVTPICELQAYPNPASNQVSFSVQLLQPDMINAYIYNTMNVLVREKHQQGVIGANTVSFNINDLVPGLYNIRVMYGNRVCYARFNKL